MRAEVPQEQKQKYVLFYIKHRYLWKKKGGQFKLRQLMEQKAIAMGFSLMTGYSIIRDEKAAGTVEK